VTRHQPDRRGDRPYRGADSTDRGIGLASRRTRDGGAAIGRIAFVGRCTHAITNKILRPFSPTGAHPIQLPAGFWLPVNRAVPDRLLGAGIAVAGRRDSPVGLG
jgi:hypothetical protein